MTAPAGVTWGVGCWQTHVLADLVADVQAAEEGGFDYIWYGNEKLHADMWLGLAAMALNSTAARVGTFVADPYSIHPAVTAAMIATLDHFAAGRAVLVLGAGGSGLHELGLERRRPLRAVEAAVETIRALLAGERVVRDEPFAADAQLHFPARADLPIWIASRGDRMLELAGRIADGVMIGTIARPDDIGAAAARIRRGTAAAGRSADEVVISTRVDVVVDDDRGAARDALRSFVAGVLSASYPDRGFIERAGLELPDELEADLPDEGPAPRVGLGPPRARRGGRRADVDRDARRRRRPDRRGARARRRQRHRRLPPFGGPHAGPDARLRPARAAAGRRTRRRDGRHAGLGDPRARGDQLARQER